jgi:hypothetical protein
MTPDCETLLATLRRAEPLGEAAVAETRALIRRAHTLEQAREWLQVFDQLVPRDAKEPLTEYLRYALLGICLGFVERDLSPYYAEHLAIVPPMLEDIRGVYDQLEGMGVRADAENFRYRAFDYGIHKAYYLDWTLYMSKECY